MLSKDGDDGCNEDEICCAHRTVRVAKCVKKETIKGPWLKLRVPMCRLYVDQEHGEGWTKAHKVGLSCPKKELSVADMFKKQQETKAAVEQPMREFEELDKEIKKRNAKMTELMQVSLGTEADLEEQLDQLFKKKLAN